MIQSNRIELMEKLEQLIEDGLIIKLWNESRQCYVYKATKLGMKLNTALKSMEFHCDK